MHVPAYEFILSQLGLERGKLDDGDLIRIPLRLLKMLLQISVAAELFDEEVYRQSFPDIAAAIKEGKFKSGAQHFLSVGYFEGRRNPSVPFDERWYIDKYPSVFNEISANGLADALDHYLAIGSKKGYAPNQEAYDQLAFWKEIL